MERARWASDIVHAAGLSNTSLETVVYIEYLLQYVDDICGRKSLLSPIIEIAEQIPLLLAAWTILFLLQE